VSANEPRFFIPNDHIQKYFESGKNEYSRAEELLHAVFNTSHIGIQALPVHPQDVTQDCCKVFCILIRIGRGEYIPQFVKYADTIGDAKLPFSRNQCPEKFPIADFYDKFVDEQWKFCAPQIKSRANLHIDADLVLPFHVCEHIQGPVHKVIIHKNHDQLVSKNRVHLLANPQLYDGAEILQAKRNDSNTYAVKVFRSSRDEVSQKKESSAFEYITKGGTRSTPGLIGFHGGFTYGDSFNLILEYAEGGTLADLLQKSADLHEGQEIFDFWSAIFETFKGLQAIHEQHIRLERGQSTEAKAVILKGWVDANLSVPY
jgi:serine/threonine protein kinase